MSISHTSARESSSLCRLLKTRTTSTHLFRCQKANITTSARSPFIGASLAERREFELLVPASLAIQALETDRVSETSTDCSKIQPDPSFENGWMTSALKGSTLCSGGASTGPSFSSVELWSAEASSSSAL
jgi:hypothetical protein